MHTEQGLEQAIARSTYVTYVCSRYGDWLPVMRGTNVLYANPCAGRNACLARSIHANRSAVGCKKRCRVACPRKGFLFVDPLRAMAAYKHSLAHPMHALRLQPSLSTHGTAHTAHPSLCSTRPRAALPAAPRPRPARAAR